MNCPQKKLYKEALTIVVAILLPRKLVSERPLKRLSKAKHIHNSIFFSTNAAGQRRGQTNIFIVTQIIVNDLTH